MLNHTQAFRQYLARREKIINSERPNNLFNEKTFYKAFISDLFAAKREVIIYSPFVSKFRADFYKRIIEKIRNRNIEVFIFTRPLDEYEGFIRPQIEHQLKLYEKSGVNIYFLSKNIHEKVAIIDRKILWEGSLNILSHRANKEMMRRTDNENSALEVMNQLKINNYIALGYKLIYERLSKNLIRKSSKDKYSRIVFFILGLTAGIFGWLLFSADFKIVQIIIRLLSVLI